MKKITATKKKKEVWDKPEPSKDSKELTPAQKAKAKARAEKAGRKYPNLIDNMWASKNAMLQKLVMVANQLDEASQFKIANQIDEVLSEVSPSSSSLFPRSQAL